MIDLKNEALRRNYDAVLKSGMFFEWYPELTGEWEKDSEAWGKIFNKVPKEEPQVRIEIQKTPSFTEVWYEGAVVFKGETYQFWLISPEGVDPHGNEYEIEVRWFFARVPREIRSMHPYIVDTFKQKQNDTGTKN